MQISINSHTESYKAKITPIELATKFFKNEYVQAFISGNILFIMFYIAYNLF